MKKISFIFLFLFFNLNNIYSQIQSEWESRYNNPINGEDDAYSIDIDTAGNSYVAGRSYNGSNYDIVTVKYSLSGNQTWIQTYNGSSNLDDTPVKIQVDFQNNIIMAGNSKKNFGYDLSLMKYNFNGNLLWSKNFYGQQNISLTCGDIDIDLNGNIYTWIGSSESPKGTFLLVKFNTMGDTLWTNKFRDTLNAGVYPVKVICAADGYIYALGYNSRFTYLIKYSQNGERIWFSRKINIITNDFCINNNGDIFVTGDKYEGNGRHFYTLKYNNAGILIWETTYSEDYETAYNIVADDSGNCYVVGNNVYNGNLITIKYNSEGNQVWLKKINNNFNGSAFKTLIDDYSNLYVLACLFINHLNRKIILTKYDNSGNEKLTYQHTNSSNQMDIPYDMKMYNDNTVFITGQSMRSVSHYDFITIKLSQLIGINPISSGIPSHFSLSQNYPNPFNPSTKIKFQIPSSALVAQTFLSVYDILGREVAILVNQQLKPGTYEVDWDASSYPSGVYFYKLITGAFTETKKMVLIK